MTSRLGLPTVTQQSRPGERLRWLDRTDSPGPARAHGLRHGQADARLGESRGQARNGMARGQLTQGNVEREPG